MTINFGQGANTAIEDVAVFANLLSAALEQKGTSDQEPLATAAQISALLRHFNEERCPRATSIYHMSAAVTRVHARDGLLRKLYGKYGMPLMRGQVVKRLCRLIAGAPSLEYLPKPLRMGPGWELYRPRSLTSGRMPVLRALVLVAVPVAIAWGYIRAG